MLKEHKDFLEDLYDLFKKHKCCINTEVDGMIDAAICFYDREIPDFYFPDDGEEWLNAGGVKMCVDHLDKIEQTHERLFQLNESSIINIFSEVGWNVFIEQEFYSKEQFFEYLMDNPALFEKYMPKNIDKNNIELINIDKVVDKIIENDNKQSLVYFKRNGYRDGIAKFSRNIK